MQLGEVYRVQLNVPASWVDHKEKRMGEGKVVFVHPNKRFATLEFKGVHGKFRESFRSDQLTENNRMRGQ